MYNRNMPVPPIEDGGNPVLPGIGNYPVPPIEGGGSPVFPGVGNYPVPPIEGGGYPVFPGVGNYPVPPIEEGGNPVFPIFPAPSLPSCNSCSNMPPRQYCRVRFFHAAVDAPRVSISIGSFIVADGLSYSNASQYIGVLDGFRTVTITTEKSPRTIVFRKTLPFRGGDIVTMAIVNSGDSIDVLPISDLPCENRPNYMSCFRVANLAQTYNFSAIDILLPDGRVVYSDVTFKEVTPFKRIRPAQYTFHVYPTSSSHYPMPIPADIETVETMPILIDNEYSKPLISFNLAVASDTMYTAYIIGSDTSATLQSIILQ